jgi:hypothetical protein
MYHTNPQFKTFRQILVLKLLALYVCLTDVSSLVQSRTILHWGSYTNVNVPHAIHARKALRSR